MTARARIKDAGPCFLWRKLPAEQQTGKGIQESLTDPQLILADCLESSPAG